MREPKRCYANTHVWLDSPQDGNACLCGHQRWYSLVSSSIEVTLPTTPTPTLTPADLMALRDKWRAEATQTLAHPHADYNSPFYDPSMRVAASVFHFCADDLDALLSRLDGHAQEGHD